MAPTEPVPGAPPMTAPPPARTLDFGASATASLLVKMTITYGVFERRDQMTTYSLFEKGPFLRRARQLAHAHLAPVGRLICRVFSTSAVLAPTGCFPLHTTAFCWGGKRGKKRAARAARALGSRILSFDFLDTRRSRRRPQCTNKGSHPARNEPRIFCVRGTLDVRC